MILKSYNFAFLFFNVICYQAFNVSNARFEDEKLSRNYLNGTYYFFY